MMTDLEANGYDLLWLDTSDRPAKEIIEGAVRGFYQKHGRWPQAVVGHPDNRDGVPAGTAGTHVVKVSTAPWVLRNHYQVAGDET